MEGFGSDLTDSAPSPDTPMSTAFASTYALPPDGDWMAWEGKGEFSPEPDFLKVEGMDESPAFTSIPSCTGLASSDSNPVDVINSAVDDVVIFGREGINDTQPLFQPLSPRTRPLLEPAQVVTNEPLSTPARPTSPPGDGVATKRYPSRNRKRKTFASAPQSTSASPVSSDDDVSQRSSSPGAGARRRPSGDTSAPAAATAPKKTAHNMIEKRYRNNLNDKIAALRDAVPALRVRANRAEGQISCSEEDEDGCMVAMAQAGRRSSGRVVGGRMVGHATAKLADHGGIAPAHKLNKATILSKATEYIMHLERLNQKMADENEVLKARVGGLERLVVMGRSEESNWN